jgi:hypothetical protein
VDEDSDYNKEEIKKVEEEEAEDEDKEDPHE